MSQKFDSCENVLAENRLKFASWTASAAARPRGKHAIKGFSSEKGLEIIKKSNLGELSEGWCKLPSPDDFDDWHEKKRKDVIKISDCVLEKKFTHGIAAKLINVYLKSLFLASSQENLSKENVSKMNAIHPPVDSQLLECLAKNLDVHQEISKQELDSLRERWKNVKWTQLDSDGYMKVIDSFKKVTSGKGLWVIEKYWPGFQF